MSTKNHLHENIHNSRLASETLDYILGEDGTVSWEELIASFNDPDKLALLYDPGRSVDEIKDIITSDADSSKEIHAGDLSSPQIVAKGLAAFWKWAKTGFELAEPAQYEARINACTNCEYYRDAPDMPIYRLVSKVTKSNKICGVCGCMVEKKARIISGTCPAAHQAQPGLSRWEEPLD